MFNTLNLTEKVTSRARTCASRPSASCPSSTSWRRCRSGPDTDPASRPRGMEARWPGTGPRAWPLVRSGAEGETVAAIQLLLAAHGYRADADAVFGPATTEQVTAYQRDHSLANDGIIGPDTWHALIVNVRAGDRGPVVMAAHRLLTAHGHPVAADGVFGQETTEAVAACQTDRHLVADGIVGPDTWSALVNLA
ncbi:peptidoglycan-binding protein [Streptomyces bobili]|uniref:peptidoglycan-binding domain-containing protein n=1 Tax=Streptomyces bobili TaxID=67280 RepID=UPI003446FDBE